MSEEQTAKVKEVLEKLGTEMREQYSALREIEDRQQRLEKTAALSEEIELQFRRGRPSPN